MSYTPLSKLGALVEQINNAIDEELDPLEIEELISNYTQAQENETDSIQAAISFSEKEVDYIDEQIKALQSHKKLVVARTEFLKKFFVKYIEQYGELSGKTKKIKGQFFSYSVVNGTKVKDTLTIDDVPERFRKFKTTEWFSQSEIKKIIDIIRPLKLEESLDKTELSKFAKESSQEHIFLEENKYVTKR